VLARLEAPGAVLSPAELLDASSLLDTVVWLKQSFRGRRRKASTAGRARCGACRLAPLVASVRRAILPNGEISDDASSEPQRIRANINRARDTIQKTLRQILRARGEEPGED